MMAMSGTRFDVFLSHNGSDKPAVERIAERLKGEGIEPWLDAWCLPPGAEWQDGIVNGLKVSAACAVFIGPQGLGDWERQEIGVAQERATSDPRYRLIPVLLPGLPVPFDESVLPPFLSLRTWVDLRSGIDDPEAFRRLVQALRPAAATADSGAAGTCPYRGLETFDEEHAGLFFGRDAEIQRLVERLKATSFLAVLGPSGSGKSSLVRAGLIPALRDGAIPGSEAWTVRVLKPGPHPLTTLAAHLLRLHPGEAMHSTVDRLVEDPRTLHLAVALARVDRPEERVLWVVDQLEEVFTLCRDDAERSAFFANLLDASARPGAGNVVVVTLRADFYPRCAAHPELAARLAAHQFLVGPLTGEGLRQVIEEPARRAGLTIEDDLVETILGEVARQPGALPLLEHALLELWRRRSGNVLTAAAYRAAGGVEGSLAKRAEEVYGGLPANRQALARLLLLRLTEPGEGTEDTRRRAGLDEVRTLHEDAGEVDAVLDALVESRLVTTSRDQEAGDEDAAAWVDVSHEALIRGWPRLREWLDEDRPGLHTHRRLTEAALDWQRLGREAEALYGGGQLAEAESLSERHPELLNELEREFLGASRRRGRRRRTLAAAGGAALTVLFAMSAVLFLLQRNEALLQRNKARSRTLASYAQAQLEADPELSLLLALEAVKRDPNQEAEDALRRALLEPQVVREWIDRGEGQSLAERRFSPGGRFVVVRDGRELVFHDVTTGTEQRRTADDLAWSPDGGFVATAGEEGIDVWQLANWRHFASVAGRALLALAPGGQRAALAIGPNEVEIRDLERDQRTAGPLEHLGIRAALFSPTGEFLVTLSDDWKAWTSAGAISSNPLASGSGGLVVFDESGTYLARVWGHAFAIWASDDLGRFPMLTGRMGGETRDLILSQSRDEQPFTSVAIHPNGVLSSAGDFVGGVRVYEGPDGLSSDLANRVIGSLLGVEAWRHWRGHIGAVNHVAFAPGDMLATAGDDSTAAVWTPFGRLVARLRGHRGSVFSVTFGPAMGEVLTSEPGAARFWRVSTPVVMSGRSHNVSEVNFGPDGQYIVAVENRVAAVWEASGGRKITVLEAEDKLVNDVAFSPDGRWLATAGGDGVVRLESLEGAQTRRIMGHAIVIEEVLFTADGRHLLSWDAEGLIQLSNLAAQEDPKRFEHGGELDDVALDSEGVHAVTVAADGTTRIWNLGAESVSRILESECAVEGAAFDPTGRRLVTVCGDGSAHLWRQDGEHLAEKQLTGEALYDPSFSPDSSSVVALGESSSAFLWRPDAGDEPVRLEGHTGTVRSARFSRDGRLVLATYGDVARAWDADDGRLVVELPEDEEGASDRPKVRFLAWSDDGSRLAVAWDDGQVEIHSCDVCAPLEDLVALADRRLRPERRFTAGERRRYLDER